MGASSTVATLVEALGDGYWLLGDDGRLLDINAHAAAQVDVDPEGLIGTRFGDLLVPRCDHEAWELLIAGIHSDSPHVLEVQLRGDDHTTPAVLVLQHRPEGLVAVTRTYRRAVRDPLTGLRSRQEMVEMLGERLLTAEQGSTRIGVMHIDLDAFESLNITFGPAIADRVLTTMAERLSAFDGAQVAAGTTAVGRIGDDEFLVVLQGHGPATLFDAELAALAEVLQQNLEECLEIDGLELRATASLGLARWPEDGDDAGELLVAASGALGDARGEGRRQVRFHEPARQQHRDRAVELDRDLRRAAARREIEVHYQPIIDLRTGAVAGGEALARWSHPEHGPIPPSMFIPAAEATGSISAVGDVVLNTVAEDLAEWNRQGLLSSGSRVAVNVSGAEFAEASFVDRLVSTLANADVPPQQIELEVTETMLMDDLETTASRLGRLHDLGFLVALDDFGTGYSSLSYLHSLPLHTLKIDRRFVGDLHNGRSETITRTILSLARALGIVAVGEGVETEHQRHFLLDAGCDLVQGYYYAPPLPRPAFEQFLRTGGTGNV